MNRKIQHFLLVFDHEDGRLIDTVEFGLDRDRHVDPRQLLRWQRSAERVPSRNLEVYDS